MKQPGEFKADLLAFRERDDEGDRFKKDAWEGFALKHREEFMALDGPILREHVFKAFAESTRKGVEFALVWGYPNGRTFAGTENEKSLKSALLDPTNFVETVDQLRYASRNALQTIKRLNEQPGLGIASTTKVAYFAQLECGFGPCLIFDKQVTKAILTLDYPELGDMRSALMALDKKQRTLDEVIDYVAQRNAAYPIYMEHTFQLTRLVGSGIAGEDIERFLFTQGREIG